QCHVAIAVKETLQDLAFGQRSTRIRRPLHDGFVEFSSELKGFNEKKIAGYQSRVEAEFFVGGLLTSPGLCLVTDIVVEQCRCLNELYRGGYVDDVLRLFSTQGQKRQKRHQPPDPFPAPLK